jgi:hypothetical protein
MRSNQRKKELGEVFTPLELVNEILDKFPEEIWLDKEKTFLDPTCGNGNFLVEVKKRLLTFKHPIENILRRVYGADIMEDNCRETICRLYDITEDDIKTIQLKKLIKTHFSYFDLPANPMLQKPSQKLEIQRYTRHCNSLDALLHSPTIRKFLRPGLIALFLNKKTDTIIPTIVQADGLVYDYSFDERELTEKELDDIRLSNKSK